MDIPKQASHREFAKWARHHKRELRDERGCGLHEIDQYINLKEQRADLDDIKSTGVFRSALEKLLVGYIDKYTVPAVTREELLIDTLALRLMKEGKSSQASSLTTKMGLQ